MNKNELRSHYTKLAVAVAGVAGTVSALFASTVHAAADPSLVNAFTNITTQTTDNVTALLPVVGTLFALMAGIAIAIYLYRRFRRA